MMGLEFTWRHTISHESALHGCLGKEYLAFHCEALFVFEISHEQMLGLSDVLLIFPASSPS